MLPNKHLSAMNTSKQIMLKSCSELPPVSWIGLFGNKRSVHNSAHVKTQKAGTTVQKVSLQIIGYCMFSV